MEQWNNGTPATNSVRAMGLSVFGKMIASFWGALNGRDAFLPINSETISKQDRQKREDGVWETRRFAVTTGTRMTGYIG